MKLLLLITLSSTGCAASLHQSQVLRLIDKCEKIEVKHTKNTVTTKLTCTKMDK